MKAALISGNTVVNVIVVDSEDVDLPGYDEIIVIEDSVAVGPGFIWSGNTNFINPIIPEKVVPLLVTARQARLLLLQKGLLSTVENMISQRDEASRITWEYATIFERDNPLLTQLSEDLGLTEEEIDEFFIEASRI